MPKSRAPKRKQVCGYVTQVEQDRCKQQREGNCDGNNQRAANIAQEEKTIERYEQNSVRQIPQDRMGGVVNEVAAVEMWDSLYPCWREAIVQFFDFLMKRVQRRIGLGTFSQQGDAFDDIVIIDDRSVFMTDCFAELSQPYLGRLNHNAEITNAYGSAVRDFNHRGSNVVRVCHQANGTDVQRLLTALDETPAGIDIVVAESLFHLAK